MKHNEKNGWNNTDGDNNNLSWNCGVEGETDDPQVNQIRRRMVKNACVILMCSRGIPMFLAGDEFGNSQDGNNNAYCQDNTISWLDWSLVEKNSKLLQFFKDMIRFRKEHLIIRKDTMTSSLNWPLRSVHGLVPWGEDFSSNNHLLCVMFAGRTEDNNKDDIIYIIMNTYWEPQNVGLPELKIGIQWELVIDTFQEESVQIGKSMVVRESLLVEPRTVKILHANPVKQR